MDKILHINDFPAGSGGGAEVVMAKTIDLLRERGFPVATFTAADLPVARRTPWRYLDNFSARQALADRLASFQPDVVHLHNYYHVLSPGILVALAAYKGRRPVRIVMTAHDYHLVCPNAGGCWFRWFGNDRQVIAADRVAHAGYLYSRCWDHRSALHSLLKLLQHGWHYRWHRHHDVIDRVICPSRFIERMLAPRGLKTCWLPHPLPAPIGRATERSGPLRFVCAGRLEPEKGVVEFLETLPADFDAELTIIGAGAELERCRQICARRGWQERVHFPGRLSHAQTLAHIADAHVLVQPSRFLESYGLTLIEALAAGTNVLASDRGAAPEILADAGAGFLYNIDDPASLTRELQAIRRRHADGTLNQIRLGECYLADRCEATYIERLLQIYGSAAARFPLAA
jgi:glycosyltransferase involved in cell wall biosynthesis